MRLKVARAAAAATPSHGAPEVAEPGIGERLTTAEGAEAAATDEVEAEPDSHDLGKPDPSADTPLVAESDKAAPRARRALSLALVLVVVLALVAALSMLKARHSDNAGAGTPALSPTAAFSVNGISVSEADLARRVQVLHVLYGVEVPTSDPELATFRRRTAQALASSIAIAQSAQEQGLAVPEDVVTSTLDRYVEDRYTGDKAAAFAQELTDNDISEQDVRDEIARQLGGQKLFNQVTSDVDITDSEAREAFEADPASWAEPEQRQLRYIAAFDQATALQAKRALMNGADFASVASRYSEDASTKDSGGELGLLTAEQLDPKFGRLAFSSPPRRLFGPVETTLGWYVGQVQRVVPAKSTFSQLRASVKSGLSADAALKLWGAYVTELTASASITYADAYKPRPGDTPTPDVPGSGQSPTPSENE